jgi:hypothetical protein
MYELAEIGEAAASLMAPSRPPRMTGPPLLNLIRRVTGQHDAAFGEVAADDIGNLCA